MRPVTMRSQTAQGSSQAASSAPRSNATVDLFSNWTTDYSVQVGKSTGASSAQDKDLSTEIQIKRSLSQESADASNARSSPRFQTINFPKKDAFASISLSKDSNEDDEGLYKDGKKVPPSKRPGVSHAKKTPPNHIKRPRNAYIIFRTHTVSQKLIPKEIEHDHRNISRIIAHMWKSLEPEDRAYYEQIALEEKEKHKSLYPDYKYQPTTRRTGVSKRKVKKLENGEEECQEIADIILKAQGKEGVVVRAEPSKAMKRAREATRSSGGKNPNASPRKRAKTGASAQSEPAEKMLTTVFLHPSPSNSPNSGSSAGIGAVQVASPEPFQLASRTPSISGDAEAVSTLPSPMPVDLFGRRASSVPTLRPCSPPPPFELTSQQQLHGDALVNDLAHAPARHEAYTTEVAQPNQVGFSDESVMPAPAFKARRAQPPPLANTWQHCSFDDQSLPSPRSFDAFGSAARQAMARPRTAMPSTPSSGSFRGFFHPWAYDNGTESMLISPMTASFQELRRRSSLVRSGLAGHRRQGSYGFDPSSHAGNRMELVDNSNSVMPAAEARESDIQLFDQAARAAAISLGAEEPATQMETGHAFAFDPALENEGGEMATSHNELVAPRSPHVSPRLATSSPRPSFSGSTLAAAARDWTSMTRRRSRLEPRSVIEPISEASAPAAVETTNASVETRSDAPQRPMNKPMPMGSSLEESVERAVMLALGKDAGLDAMSGDRNSKIVQEILSSLNAELSLHSLVPGTNGHIEHAAGLTTSTTASEPYPRPTHSLSRGAKAPSTGKVPLRSPCGSAPSFRSTQYYTNAPPTEGHRVPKPLPSPLQLVMSNHEMASADAYAHSYASGQHCS